MCISTGIVDLIWSYTAMTKLLLATKNQGKIKELKELLVGLNVDLITPLELGRELELEESGMTYFENAAKKAAAYAQTSSLFSLADDSGLEVEALAGAPGIYSARYSPKPSASDRERRQYLLENLRKQEMPWKAHFHCTVVLATPTGEIHSAEGRCPGEIISEERGKGGFGYDPIFLIPELGKTMAELDLAAKNRISHRARAVNSIMPVLLNYFESSSDG
jgi:XTP/dITP diphosphohydrolase